MSTYSHDGRHFCGRALSTVVGFAVPPPCRYRCAPHTRALPSLGPVLPQECSHPVVRGVGHPDERPGPLRWRKPSEICSYVVLVCKVSCAPAPRLYEAVRRTVALSKAKGVPWESRRGHVRGKPFRLKTSKHPKRIYERGRSRVLGFPRAWLPCGGGCRWAAKPSIFGACYGAASSKILVSHSPKRTKGPSMSADLMLIAASSFPVLCCDAPGLSDERGQTRWVEEEAPAADACGV